MNKTESSRTSSSPLRHRLVPDPQSSFLRNRNEDLGTLIAGIVLAVLLPALLFALAQPASAQSQSCVPAAIAVGQVNVRSGPSQAFEPPIGTLVAGQSVQVTGRLADNSWYRILFNGREGWVFGQLMATSCMGSVPVVPAPPGPIPTPIPGPNQANFTADATTLTQGQCTTLRWSVTEVAGVWLIVGQYQTSVPGVSAQTVCPGTTSAYRLRVQRLDGSVFEQSLTINVIPNTSGLPNPNFRAEAYSLSAGQCTILRWNITNVRAVFFWDGANAQGVSGTDSRQVCPNSTTTYRLQVVYNDGQAQDWYVTVAVTSAGGDSSITFAGSPPNIQRGGCAVLTWQVAGPFNSITLFDTSNSSSSVVGADGNMTVCPENTTQYVLRVTGMDDRITERSVTIGVFTASTQ